MKRLAWLLPLLFVAVVTAAAPSLPQQGAAALSTFLKDATDRGDVPGVVVAVVNKDGVLYNEAFGKSSTLRNTPMTKDTIFNMASMTKPVTSVAIMMLVDEGKLKLDDDVAKYLPKYKDPLVISKFNDADASYETRPAKRPITIRHLLTHTSGIGYGFSSPMLTKIMQKTKQDRARSSAPVRSGRELGLWRQHARARPRRRGDLGTEDRCVSRVAHPAAARHERHELPGADGEVSARRRGERARRRRQVRGAADAGHPARAPLQGDGGLYGTASDYGLFLRMLLNRGTLGDKRILSEKSVKTMLREPHGQRGGAAAGVSESVAVEELPRRRRQGPMGTRLSARRRANCRTDAARGAGRGPASSTRTSSSIRAARSASS